MQNYPFPTVILTLSMSKLSRATGPAYDVVLIGAGIMSASLAVLLKELHPDFKIAIFEKLDQVAAESSDAWNNAGTGHAALCELNYTPEREDGSMDLHKAIHIFESFEISKQFWAYLVGHGYFETPDTFIHSVPHMSLVWGDENIAFLQKRYALMQDCHLFHGMEYTEDRAKLEDWMPIIMEERAKDQHLAATRMDIGTDVNFGALTRSMFQHLKHRHGVEVLLQHEVQHLEQDASRVWHLEVEDQQNGEEKYFRANFVFIGAGGGSLPLLDKSDIAEGQGFGGFPVSGQWLVCKNPNLIARHHAKVYGKASVGTPPMSVPHLDTRVIDGEKALLFGPYAGFTTKFLKQGSFLDLPRSIDFDNLGAMLGAWVHNLPLTSYLIKQVTQSMEDRMDALREFVPTAEANDWELAKAGQRVQVIKKDAEHGGILEFGTEIVRSADGSIAALLGASPGASTAVSIMLELLEHCMPEQMQSEAWRTKLKEIIPTYGVELIKNQALAQKTQDWTHKMLQL
jgi:malate dehydrogenase (quinone)